MLRDNAAALTGESVVLIGTGADRAAVAMDRRFGGFVDGILAKQQLHVDEGSRTKIIMATAAALDQAAEVNLRKAEGDYRPDPEAERFPEWKSEAKQDRVTISGLFELWKREHQQLGGAASSVRRWSPVVKSFIGHVGHDDARLVTLGDAIRWKDDLMASGLSASTFKKTNRAALSTIFRVGVSRALLPENPFTKLEAKVPKKRRERDKGFSAEEAQRILSASSKALTAPGKMLARTRSAIRWIPWLCAYSGARVNEVAQLHRRSVYEIEGIHCFAISPEDGSVKDGDLRYVPIHEHLVAQGFLDFVEAAEEGPLFYDPDTTNAVPSEQAASKVRQWVRQKLALQTPG